MSASAAEFMVGLNGDDGIYQRGAETGLGLRTPRGVDSRRHSARRGSIGWSLAEGALAGFTIMLTISGAMIGLRMLIGGKDDPVEPDDGIPPDRFGLDRGVKAKSLGGWVAQTFLRSCRDSPRGRNNGPDRVPGQMIRHPARCPTPVFTQAAP